MRDKFANDFFTQTVHNQNTTCLTLLLRINKIKYLNGANTHSKNTYYL